MSAPDAIALLIAASDEVGLGRIARLAREAGWTCTHVSNAHEAEKLLATSHPNVVLVDSRFSSEDIASLRAACTVASIPILARSKSPEDIAHAFELGLDDVITHDASGAELLGRIRHHHHVRMELDELARKRRDAQVMLELTQALATSLDIRDILFTIAKRIAEVVRVDRASIVLAPEEGNTAWVVATSDEDKTQRRDLDLAKYPEIQQVLRTGEVLTIDDVSKHPLLDDVRADVSKSTVSSLTLLPIRWNDEVIGVLFLRAAAHRGVLSKREIELCRIIANASASALHNARAMQVLRDQHKEVSFARFQAEATKSFLEKLIAASVDAIVAADMRGTILLFNGGAERIYGYKAEDVIGKMNVSVLYPGDGAKEVMRMMRSQRHGGVDRVGNVLLDAVNKDGERIPISLSAALIRENDKPIATFGIFTDLREKMRVERRLEEAQAQLALSERQLYLAELAGAAAHELNQPLTSILAYAEMLRRRLSATPSEQRYVDVIFSQGERMAEIIRKIGRITKYETTAYVGSQRIIDINKSAADSEPTRK